MNAETNLVLQWMIDNPLAAVILMIWALVWKGLALWKSAGLRQKYWFIAMLVLNTLGILEIIYLIISRKHKVEVVEQVRE